MSTAPRHSQPLAVPVDQIVGAFAREQGELDQLFHHVDHALLVGRWLHAAVFPELHEGLGDRRLVGDGVIIALLDRRQAMEFVSAASISRAMLQAGRRTLIDVAKADPTRLPLAKRECQLRSRS